eukprot:3835043-Pleurochrysis_carterae.AAC.1
MTAFISLRSIASMSSGPNMNCFNSSGASGAKGDGVLWRAFAVVAAAGAEPACGRDRVVGAAERQRNVG